MKNYKITTKDTNELLFAGYFKDFKSCLEAAVNKHTPLNNANLSHQNLSNANLDDGIFAGADFSGSNLSGVNISEAYCKGANFNRTSLFNASFAYSNLTNSDFQNSLFGGTDIVGALIDGSTFSTLSAFSLDFNNSRQMHDCKFVTPDNSSIEFSSPPITIKGLRPQLIIILENHILEGQQSIQKHHAKHWLHIVQKLQTNSGPSKKRIKKT